jgi:DNA-binding NtrC family response regulator
MTKNELQILILEDNQFDCNLITRELSKHGIRFAFRLATDRNSFEKEIDSLRPDIVLSDYKLPAFDGLTAYHLCRRKYPDVPFIIISGTIGEENAIELIKSGITDYALKDKLFVLPMKILRALADADIRMQKKIEEEKLIVQNEKLLEIAFLQAHQVRRPIASILGLINLLDDEKNPDMLMQVVPRIRSAAIELDQIIAEIVHKTEEITKTDRT